MCQRCGQANCNCGAADNFAQGIMWAYVTIFKLIGLGILLFLEFGAGAVIEEQISPNATNGWLTLCVWILPVSTLIMAWKRATNPKPRKVRKYSDTKIALWAIGIVAVVAYFWVAWGPGYLLFIPGTYLLVKFLQWRDAKKRTAASESDAEGS